jgi:glutamine synthetase
LEIFFAGEGRRPKHPHPHPYNNNNQTTHTPHTAHRTPHTHTTNNNSYLEDRRPAANVDPYQVARLLIKTTLK